MSDLTAFPMDSQVTGMGDDGLPVYDRAFDSTDLREVYKTYFSNGYFAEVGTSMHVKAASGMTATVEAGKVNIQGTLGFMTEDATVTFAESGSAPRIDTVVARLDLSVEKRTIELDVLTGVPGGSAPALTRDATVWELGLADVTIPQFSTAIAAENIRDTRLDTTRCGVVNPFAKLDTDSLFEQVTAIITAAGKSIEQDTARLERATADAVSAMNDALSSTVLGSVWRLSSSSTADYLAYGDDLNDIASVCTRFCGSASVAGGILNKPDDVTGAFALYTFATEQDPSRLGQMLLAVDASGVSQFFRSGAGSNWSAWSVVRGVDQTARDAAAAAQSAADNNALSLNGGYEGRSIKDLLGCSTWDATYAALAAKKHTELGFLRLGDYLDVTLTSAAYTQQQTLRFVVADVDPYYMCGNTAISSHHVAFVASVHVGVASSVTGATTEGFLQWNTSSTNNGTSSQVAPYMASNLHAWEQELASVLPSALSSVLLERRVLLETRYSSSGSLTDSTGWAWNSVGKIFSLSETEVYGQLVWGTKGWSVGADTQFAIFRHNRWRLNSDRVRWWLRSVRGDSSSAVCHVDYHGSATATDASYGLISPRPGFLLTLAG